MVIEACHCSWGIPGVTNLPAHNHVYTGEYEEVPNTHGGPFKTIPRAIPDQERIHIWVNWKEVARAMAHT